MVGNLDAHFRTPFIVAIVIIVLASMTLGAYQPDLWLLLVSFTGPIVAALLAMAKAGFSRVRQAPREEVEADRAALRSRPLTGANGPRVCRSG